MLADNLKLSEIEALLKKTILVKKLSNQLTIWGELEITEYDYSVLIAKLHEALVKPGSHLKNVLESYTLSFVTAAVFMTKYHYNNNFWRTFGDDLGKELTPNHQQLIGQACLDTFAGFSFDTDLSDITYTYLDPICYQAGVPTAGCLDGLFYALKYDTGNSFDPVEIIDDLINEHGYGVRKTLIKYLKRFKDDRALDCLLEIHDAILAVDQGIPGDSWYLRSYSEWLKRERERKDKAREQDEVFAKPYLVLDERYGLCLQMPRVFLKQEYVEKPKWTILCDEDGKEIFRTMNVYDDYGRRKVGETRIPVPPANVYYITLTDSESLEEDKFLVDPWEIAGAPEGGILFFNADGRNIVPRFLQYPYVTLLLADESAKIINSQYTEENEQYYPLMQGSKAKLISIAPQDYRAKLKVLSRGMELSLEARPRIDIELEGKHLFNCIPVSGMHVFTELPEVKISSDNADMLEDFEIRCGQTILFKGNSTTDHIMVFLSDFRDKCFTKFGVYSIRVYKSGQFLKSVDFGFAPDVETSYNPALVVPAENGRGIIKELDFDCEKALEKNPGYDISLDFGQCIVKHFDNHCIVDCPANKGTLNGHLNIENDDVNSSGKISMPFSLPLRPFDFTVFKSYSEQVERQPMAMSYKLTLEDIEKENLWLLLDCYGQYITREYYLKLNTVNGYIQTQKLKKNGGTSFSCTLSAFSATLQDCPLPARLEICVYSENGEIISVPVAAITKESGLSVRPAHRFKNDKSQIFFRLDGDKGKDIILQSFTHPENKITFPYSKSGEGTTKKGTQLRVFTGDYLKPGFYSVSAGETADDPFGFEEELGVSLTNGYDTIYVTEVPERKIYPDFSQWLDSLMTDIMIAGPLKEINDKQSYKEAVDGKLGRWKDTVLTSADCANLTALVWLANDRKCNKDKLWQIKRCMSEISCIILTPAMRTELARFMLSLNCPAVIMRSAIHYFDFMLMSTSDDAGELAEKFAPYSDELSVLLQMRRNAPLREAFSDKGMRTIGKEALRIMMTVPDTEDANAVVLEQRKFLRGMKEANVTIELPPEIAGKEEWVKPEIETRKNKVILNLDKMQANLENMQANEVPLNGIRFAEQYINWFRLRMNKNYKTIDVQLLDEEFEPVMIKAIHEDCVKLVKFYKGAGNDPATHTVQRRYNHGIRERYTQDVTANLSTAIPMRFFYVQAIAAFLAVMPARYNPNPDAVKTAQHFLSMAAHVATRMVRRDILMAEAFYYLIGKEEELCQ